MTERTITSDLVRCPKCYSSEHIPSKKVLELDRFAMPIWGGGFTYSTCKVCAAEYTHKTTRVVTCTEVPND